MQLSTRNVKRGIILTSGIILVAVALLVLAGLLAAPVDAQPGSLSGELDFYRGVWVSCLLIAPNIIEGDERVTITCGRIVGLTVRDRLHQVVPKGWDVVEKVIRQELMREWREPKSSGRAF